MGIPSLQAVRGRVEVVQNGAWDYAANRYDPEAPGRTVVTDQGTLLRAATFHCRTFRPWEIEYANDFENWKLLPEKGFNCVRLNLHNWTIFPDHNSPIAWLGKAGWVYSPEFGWIYPVPSAEGVWLYNASEDSWRLVAAPRG